jgi:molecular chaperone GrpE
MTDANSETTVPSPESSDAGAEEAAQFESDLASLQRERDDLLDTTRRLQADFENYRKRVVREQTALVERSTEGLLEQLLPVLDSFELAVRNLEGGDVDEKVRKGIELVYAELTSVMERSGLERIACEGELFDPNEHEAVMQDDGEGEPHVADVLRTGWKLKGRVLRPAMVKVTRKTNE